MYPRKVVRVISAEISSCKIPLTTDRNATFAKSNDFWKTFFNMFVKPFLSIRIFKDRTKVSLSTN